MREEIPSVVLNVDGVKGRFLEERLDSGSLDGPSKNEGGVDEGGGEWQDVDCDVLEE